MTRQAGSVAVVLLAVALASGCQKQQPMPQGGGNKESKLGLAPKGPRVGGLGEKKLAGEATDLRAAPDGKVVTALLDVVKPRLEGVPPPMRLGELWAVPTTSGEPVKLANGATNMPGGSLFSPDSKWALMLAGYNAAVQAGELLAQDLTDLKKERVHLGGVVTYYVPSPDSKQIAFVEEGVLKVGKLPEGPFRTIAGEVATAEFAPDGQTLYFRRKVAAAGGLFQVSLADEKKPPRKLTDQVGDYELSDDGKKLAYVARPSLAATRFELFVVDTASLKSVKVADGVLRFAFSKDGKWLLRLQGDSPTQPGELWLGSTEGGAGRKLGDKVKDFSFSADGTKLVFRQNYREVELVGQQLERVGELMMVQLPDGAPKLIQKVCPNFVFSPDGKALAYTATIFRPLYSRDLFLLRDGGEPVKLKEWLYEYAFAPNSDKLYFRADCTREGRSCFLLSVDVAKPEAQAVQEAEAVYNFRLSADGARVLFTYAHTSGETYDVSVLNLKTKERKTIEQDVKLPIHFLEKDGSRLAYVVAEKPRAGVYVADKVP